MKFPKIILITSFSLIALTMQAQWQLNSPYLFYNGGNVGIGTDVPASLLQVNGTLTAGNAGGGYHLVINDINTARWAFGTGDYGLHIANDFTPLSTTWTERVFISKEGNVGIGTRSSGYKLAVNGGAIFTRVVVKAYPWPDYVFQANYRLRPLSEVEKYIKQYGHLPEVATADEVEKNGVDVGDNQATLLKKIEELTLYVIEQDKQIKKLQTENKELELLKKDVEAMKAVMQRIKQ